MLKKTLILACMCVCVFGFAWAAPALAVVAQPKLLYLGGNIWDPSDLLSNSSRLQALPFNGYMFEGYSVVGSGRLSQSLGTSVFGPVTFSSDDYSGFVSRARQLLQIAPSRVTDNFIRITMLPGNLAPGSNPDDPDRNAPVSFWLDDVAFARVVQNMRVATEIAQDAGMKGLSFDIEPYGGQLWDYALQQDAQQQGLTLAETNAIVRGRGQQIMRAIQDVNPDMTLLFLATYHWNNLGLSTSFLDGIYDVVDARTHVVDGYENYSLRSAQDFRAGYSQVHNLNAGISNSPVNYSKFTTAGNAVYLEASGWNAATGQSPEYTPQVWKTTLKNALKVTDEYTWVFNQSDVTQNHPNWLSGANFDEVAYDQATREAIAESQWDVRVYQDGLNGYSGTRDTFIHGPSPLVVDRNAGADTGLTAGFANSSFQYQTLIKFTDLDLPADLDVYNARLVLYVKGIGDTFFDPAATKQDEIHLSIQGLLQDFTEGDNHDTDADTGETTYSALHFNEQSWNLPGAAAKSSAFSYDGNADRHATSDDILSGPVALGQFVVFDVTESFVNQLQNGKEYGWIVSLAGTATNYTYLNLSTSEDPMFAFRPQLQITYAAGALDGDVNFDGFVNIFDINLVSANWGTAGPTADANHDGIVNIFDINLISANWSSGGGGSAAAVPEPGSLALAALGLVGLADYRWRQRRR